MLAVRAPALNFAALLLAGAALSACSTVHPTLSSRLPTGPAGQSATPGAQASGQGGVYKVGKPYQVGGIWYVPKEEPGYDATGVASWYGADFHQKATANGETYDMYAMTAAHTTLPMPSIVEVTNLDNGRKTRVRVNDRGPFVGGRIIDLSYSAARELGYENKGLANVRVRYIGPAPLGVGDGQRYASASGSPAAGAPLAPVAAAPVIAARPIAPPAAVAAQNLPPIAAAPVRYAAAAPASTYSGPAYSGSTSGGYSTPSVTYAPTARPDYRAPTPASYSPPPSYASPVSRPPIASPPVSSPTVAGAYRVQAAAFSDPAKAQQVADELAAAAPTRVEPVQREGAATLYRVMLQASNDEGQAWALRDRIATYGYADARVIRPF